MGDHYVVLKKRHSMLKHLDGPEIEKECAECGTSWPCEVMQMKATLDLYKRELKAATKAKMEVESTLAHVRSNIAGYNVKAAEANRDLRYMRAQVADLQREVVLKRTSNEELYEANQKLARGYDGELGECNRLLASQLKAMDEVYIAEKTAHGVTKGRLFAATSHQRINEQKIEEQTEEIERLRAEVGNWKATVEDEVAENLKLFDLLGIMPDIEKGEASCAALHRAIVATCASPTCDNRFLPNPNRHDYCQPCIDRAQSNVGGQ